MTSLAACVGAPSPAPQEFQREWLVPPNVLQRWHEDKALLGPTFAGSPAWRRHVEFIASLDRLAHQMVYPYLSIYIVALGATATQLGLVNSLGMAVGGLAGPLTGWLIDRHGPRTFYLVGIGFLAVSYLTYALANSWPVTIVAMMVYWLGYSISGHSCATICGNCLANTDRATAMMICETVGAGLLGIVGPMLGALIVFSSGDIDPDAIRPLFDTKCAHCHGEKKQKGVNFHLLMLVAALLAALLAATLYFIWKYDSVAGENMFCLILAIKGNSIFSSSSKLQISI